MDALASTSDEFDISLGKLILNTVPSHVLPIHLIKIESLTCIKFLFFNRCHESIYYNLFGLLLVTREFVLLERVGVAAAFRWVIGLFFILDSFEVTFDALFNHG